MQLLRRNHRESVATPPPVVDWPFEIGIGLFPATGTNPQAVYADMAMGSRPPALVGDGYRNGVVFPALDPTDRWPIVDFAQTIPRVITSASPQVMKCKLFGLASSITVTSAAGWSLGAVTVVGDNTEFDVNIAASTPTDSDAILTFTGTRRLASDPVTPGGLGCRGLVMKYPGITLADTNILMPYMATALAPFSWIRFMDVSAANNNYYTITPGDRAAGLNTIRARLPSAFTAQTMSIETAVAVCNELGKSMWWCIPSPANDALVADMATYVRDNLDPGLYCIYELGNENWNPLFWQQPWWISTAFTEVDGYTFQYSESVHINLVSRTGNVVTADFGIVPHGFTVGDQIWTQSVGVGPVNGVKTILTTPDPYTATWAEVGANYTLNKANTGSVRSKNVLLTANRLGTVMTLTFGRAHGMTAGVTQIKCVGFSGAIGTAQTVISTPTATSITTPCTAGVDGAIVLGGGSSCAVDFASPLNSYDQAQDQFILARRMYGKRTYEIGQIIEGLYGADFGTKAYVGLFNQPGVNQYDQITCIATSYGTPSDFIHAIGQGSYAQLNATAFGGPNLRNVSTYDGNTPPLMSDYVATWQLTGDNIMTSSLGNHDGTAMTARLYNLEMWEYEFGPDATASGGDPDIAGPAANAVKIDTLHDASYAPAYAALLDTLEASKFSKITVYHAGTCLPGATSALLSWQLWRDYLTPSIRATEVVNKLAAPRTGPTRNLLSITVPVTIDGRAILGIYTYTGAFPSVIVGTNPPMQNWIITAPEAGDWSFEPTFTCSSGTKNIIVQVNGVALPNYVVPLGTNIQAPVTVSLTKGHNVFRTVPGTSNPGTTVTCNSFLFTPVP